MQFLSGVLFAVLFFSAVIAAYILGQRSKQTVAQKAVEVNEEERKKAQRMREGFDQMMAYDVTTATKGRVM